MNFYLRKQSIPSQGFGEDFSAELLAAADTEKDLTHVTQEMYMKAWEYDLDVFLSYLKVCRTVRRWGNFKTN